MQISQLQVGHTAKIAKVLGCVTNIYRKRLIAMGLIPGTQFTVSRIAPLGDPIEICVRGYFLSVRKNECQILVIEEIK